MSRAGENCSAFIARACARRKDSRKLGNTGVPSVPVNMIKLFSERRFAPVFQGCERCKRIYLFPRGRFSDLLSTKLLAIREPVFSFERTPLITNFICTYFHRRTGETECESKRSRFWLDRIRGERRGRAAFLNRLF